MNLTSLDARNIDARQRITAAAAALADALELPALVVPTAIEQRQPAVAQMRELEQIAVLLEGVCAALIGRNSHDRQETNPR